MKKVLYLIVAMAILGLIVPGCIPVVPPAEQDELSSLTKVAGTTWHVPVDFATIQDAIDSVDVLADDTIIVGPGNHAGATVTKAVEIKGGGGAVINSGPVHESGLIQGFRIISDGATISHFTFEVDFPIMGDYVDDVTIKHNVLNDPVQGISNWGGSRWKISHNEIIDLCATGGGGIGILIADWKAISGGVNDNLVSHNKITGTLHVDPGDGGDYNGSGIVLYADFRWEAPGADAIAYNRVVHNKISLTSDNPDVVDVVAIELTDTRDDPDLDCVIFDNAIGFNDLRGTVLQIELTPDNLGDCNDISRNLGDNRGHGLHPSSVFSPGGN